MLQEKRREFPKMPQLKPQQDITSAALLNRLPLVMVQQSYGLARLRKLGPTIARPGGAIINGSKARER